MPQRLILVSKPESGLQGGASFRSGESRSTETELLVLRTVFRSGLD